MIVRPVDRSRPAIVFLCKEDWAVRDYARINRMCSLLQACWMHYPDQRFFQLITNLLHTDKTDLFFVEDDETEKMFKDFLDKAIKEAGR